MGKRVNTAVWHEKHSRWQIKVQKDGVRKSFYSNTPGRTGQRECNKKADEWLDEDKLPTRINVSKASGEYIDRLKLTTSLSHWGQYEYYFRKWINPKIGNVKLENLTEQNVQSVIDNGYAHKLSKKTLVNIRGCMTNFLLFCRKSNYTSFRPEFCTIPVSAPKKKKRILQPEDVRILFTKENTIFKKKEVFDHDLYAYRFEVVTGLRPGELIGLKWSDIRGRIIHIQRAINVHKEETTGKNENAIRSFALTDLALGILEKQKKYQAEQNIESEYVFTNRFGDVLVEHTYYKHWCKFRDYNGIGVPVSLYELRHTFVSMVKTLPEGFLKDLVGHSKSMDTYGVYSHNYSSDKNQTAELVQNILDEFISEK
jgi:integrase